MKRRIKMRRIFKLRSAQYGELIHTTILSGNAGQTLANTGTLIQTMGDWQLFGAILKLGAESNKLIRKAVLVILDGDAKIIEGFSKDEVEVREDKTNTEFPNE